MEQIVVQNLTKIYGTQRAVDDISFSAKQGEILGFLGPNGAGKSTTMKMLTAFVSQDAGDISICGLDPAKQPLDVKRRIGYLPEHNPLYLDMYVKEYLLWLAKVHGISNQKARVAEVIEQVGLSPEKTKKIGQLSKGYRQRVGLAQAIIHDPEVLILDEPTTGLDPNQLVEIRGLIKQLGKEKTLIFSSHIMQEVQAICDRVVIINQGKIVANKHISELGNSITSSKNIRVIFEHKIDVSRLQNMAHVRHVKLTGQQLFDISYDESQDIRAAIFDFAVANNNRILEMKPIEESIESIFGKLTQNQEN